MPTAATASEIQADFDEIAALSPIAPPVTATDRWIERNLPRQRRALLEIGCGVGDLARRLAPHFERSDAIDLSPGMVGEARGRTPSETKIEFSCVDLFEWLDARPETYDCIVTVTTLHHVDLAAALRAMARSLAPGGRLLVVDLDDRSGVRHVLANALAHALSAIRLAAALLQRRSSLRLRLAYRRHGRKETYLRLDEVRRVAAATIPGAIVGRTLFWRYTLLWDKPRR
jgi:SAM-dependent methyltransferase